MTGSSRPASTALYQSLAKSPLPDGRGQWLSQASELLDRGELARAKLVLEAVLEELPTDLQARVLLVKACLALGPAHWPEAVEVAQLAVQQQESLQHGKATDRAEAQLALASAVGHVARTPEMSQQERSDHRASARGMLEGLLEGHPSQPAALYNLALILAEGGHHSAAMERAREVLAAAQGGSSVAASNGSGVAASNGSGVPASNGSGGGGSALDQRCLALTLCLVSLLLSARQQFRSALSISQSYSSLLGVSAPDPTDTDMMFTAPEDVELDVGPSTDLPQHEYLLLRIQAMHLLAMNDASAGLGVLGGLQRRIMAAAAVDGIGEARRSELLRQQATVWQDLAHAYTEQGQLADARYSAEKLQKLVPWSPDTFHTLGLVEEAEGKLGDAVDRFDTALSLDAAHAPSLMSLGMLYRRYGHDTDLVVAHGLLLDTLRYDPHSHEGWYNLGLLCQSMQNKEGAQRHLSSAVRLAAVAPVLSYSTLPLLT